MKDTKRQIKWRQRMMKRREGERKGKARRDGVK